MTASLMSGNEKPAGERRENPIRTFVCIEIADAVKNQIADLQCELKQIDAHVSWVKPANIHLTLKFLGPVEPSRIAAVREAVARATSSCRPFEVEVSGTGCFPSARSPRILWVGLSQVPNQLQQLHQTMEDEFAREGFAREQKLFSPHLTIGRIRSPRGARESAEKLINSGFTGLTFRATEVIVMRSDLSPTGSLYTRLALIQLG